MSGAEAVAICEIKTLAEADQAAKRDLVTAVDAADGKVLQLPDGRTVPWV